MGGEGSPLTRRFYRRAAIGLLATELFIAIFVRDAIVRPYLGDVLAVMLVYAAIRAVAPIGVVVSAIAAFGLACAIELAQLFDLLGLFGLERIAVARIVLGSSFDPVDLIAYGGGAAAVLIIETVVRLRIANCAGRDQA